MKTAHLIDGKQDPRAKDLIQMMNAKDFGLLRLMKLQNRKSLL